MRPGERRHCPLTNSYVNALLCSEVNTSRRKGVVMPRPKRDNWERVTITISTEVAQLLRLAAAAAGTEMGAEADRAIRRSDIQTRMDWLMGKGPEPKP